MTKERAQVGDVVMMPTNNRGTVTAVAGDGPYDEVTIVDHTLQRYTSKWRQNQLIVHRKGGR